jgi:putative transposase
MVDTNYSKISTRRQYKLLGLPRSSYHYEPKGEKSANIELMVELHRLCLEYPAWGVTKLRDHFNYADHK